MSNYFFLGFRADNYYQKDLFALGLKLISSKLEVQHDLEDSGFSIFIESQKKNEKQNWVEGKQ